MLPTTTALPRPAPEVPTGRAAAPLRVVPEPGAEASRRLRNRRLVLATGMLVALGLLAVVSAHVMLMQGQFELERLEQRSAAEQADYDRLRLQVSQLESPDRIVAAAQQKLGMVSPATITYLAPSSDPSALPADPAGQVEAAGSPPSAPPAGGWSSVKPTLAGG